LFERVLGRVVSI